MAYANWAAVPAAVKSTIGNLLTQWNGLTSGNITPPNWALLEMANGGVNSLFSFGQYMNNHMGSGKGAYFVPQSQYQSSIAWARVGLTQDQYMQALSQYQDVYQQETGTGGNNADFNAQLVAMSGDLNTSLLQENIIHSAAMQQQYGWLKYGMTYDQFESQKNTVMAPSFGHALTDQQGVLQLQYDQQSKGSNTTATASPTFTQAEKQQAQQGAAATTSAIR